jgi:hypothetical protein
MPKSKYYAILTYPSNHDRKDHYSIFKGKTELAAIRRAKEWMIETSPDTRAEYEEKHGEVSDVKFLEELDKRGFITKPAELEEED